LVGEGAPDGRRDPVSLNFKLPLFMLLTRDAGPEGLRVDSLIFMLLPWIALFQNSSLSTIWKVIPINPQHESLFSCH
jgi:hypothetical protein